MKDLERDYRRAGFGNRLGFGERPALVVVDMVMAYFEPSSPLYAGVEGIVAPAKAVLEAARAAGVPVIYTVVRYHPSGRDGGWFFRKVSALKVFAGDGPLGAIHPELAPRADELVVVKQYASAFFGTSLAATLAATGRDSCVIMGLSTSGCVRASALDALQHGFIPLVVADACGDRDRRVHEANLFDLAAKYADGVESGEVIAAFARLRDR